MAIPDKTSTGKSGGFDFGLQTFLTNHAGQAIEVFEDLNIAGMKGLWGRKVSDLGFAQFIKLLQWVAFKRGKQVIFIDRWQRTTGNCSRCRHEQKLELKDRVFECHHCGLVLDRDHNAAMNILEAGHRLILSQLVEVSPLESIQR